MACLSFVYALVFALCGSLTSQEVTGLVEKGGSPIAATVTFESFGSVLLPVSSTGPLGKDVSTDQVITTTVQDPSNPKEPWVVTTYRRGGESPPAFINRHSQMVTAVRSALGA